MTLKNFFDYPTQEQDHTAEELVFLPHWDAERWKKLLNYAGKLKFQQGDVIIKYGDRDRAIYIIIEGQLEILIPHQGKKQLQRTQVREAGSVIGEQAFIDKMPRSATVRAITDGEMLRLNETAFEVLAAREPELARDILFDLARLLSIKLRQANRFISDWVK